MNQVITRYVITSIVSYAAVAFRLHWPAELATNQEGVFASRLQPSRRSNWLFAGSPHSGKRVAAIEFDPAVTVIGHNPYSYHRIEFEQHVLKT